MLCSAEGHCRGLRGRSRVANCWESTQLWGWCCCCLLKGRPGNPRAPAYTSDAVKGLSSRLREKSCQSCRQASSKGQEADIIGSRLPWDTLGESKTHLGRIAEGSVKIPEGASRRTLKLDETDSGPLIIRHRHLQVDSQLEFSYPRLSIIFLFQINILYTNKDTRVCTSDVLPCGMTMLPRSSAKVVQSITALGGGGPYLQNNDT